MVKLSLQSTVALALVSLSLYCCCICRYPAVVAASRLGGDDSGEQEAAENELETEEGGAGVAAEGNDDSSFVLETLLETALPTMLNQRPNNENGTAEQFEHFALHDQSNENIGHSTPQQIISRSGYNYENHHVLADDGYITQLIRIINPLADQSKLKQPPVMMFHGGIIDPTVWIWASAIQHHPEPWPRAPEDRPITSWNRSLAFVLANNGYDVWLVGTRGSNRQNQGHKRFKAYQSVMAGENKDKNMTMGESMAELAHPGMYWHFSMDDIIQHEVPRQVDKVLEVSGAQKVNLIVLSLSSQISLSFLAAHPKYAKRVNSYVVLAPIINNKGVNNFMGTLHRDFCSLLPDTLGTIVYTNLVFTQTVRDLALSTGQSRQNRYSLLHAATTAMCGPSARYLTDLEPGVVGHLFQPLGFKHLKHYCQQVLAGQLQKFDYGPIRNQVVYGSPHPPMYNISNGIGVKNWLVVSGGNDNLATISSVNQVLRQARPKAKLHLYIPKYNHLDLIAAFDNDVNVNLPVLQFVDRYQLAPLGAGGQATNHHHHRGHQSQTRENLDQFVPAERPNDPSYRDSISLADRRQRGRSLASSDEFKLVSEPHFEQVPIP